MTRPAFDPAGFHDLAHLLAADGPQDERYLRTSISRAYYACFHLARLGCQRKWAWDAPGYGQHRAVIRKLRDQRQAPLAQALTELLDMRERADYDLDTPVGATQCQKALDRSSWLVPRLRSL